VIVPLSVLVGHAFAVVHALARREAYVLPSEFGLQFILLLGVSLSATIGASFVRLDGIRGVLIAVRVFCVLVATAALGDDFVVKIVLYTTLLIEVIRLSTPGYAIVAASGITVLVTIAQRQFVAWGSSVAAPQPTEWIALGMILTLISVLLVRSMNLDRRVGRLSEAVDDLTRRADSLVSVNLTLQQQSLEEQIAAATEERKRVTRDVHDTVCYAFSAIIMMMNDAIMAARRHDSTLVERLHNQTMEIARESLNDTRVSLRLFRQLESYGLPLATRVRKLTESFQLATGMTVRVHFASLPGDLSPLVDEAVQRLIQEALSNSVRHGRCRAMDISFGLTDAEFIVTAQDDGSAPGELHEGIGLKGMRERVEAAGGTLTVTGLDVGFVVSARFPVASSVVGREVNPDER
jgi:signal transduction histidine kinase